MCMCEGYLLETLCRMCLYAGSVLFDTLCRECMYTGHYLIHYAASVRIQELFDTLCRVCMYVGYYLIYYSSMCSLKYLFSCSCMAPTSIGHHHKLQLQERIVTCMFNDISNMENMRIIHSKGRTRYTR